MSRLPSASEPGVVMPPKPLEPGDPTRLGRFELLGRLGEGGQGVVYLGRGDGPGEERVAVKVLRSTVDPMVLERLGRELDAIHQVQPFVTARVIEASADGERRFVVSEYIDGPSLQERVQARGPLVEGELLRLAVGTATALTAIHGAGVVHRDFKPANVLLGPDGPRVVDFGIARLTDASTITSGLIGTPSFVSPEQLAGARPTSAVDIFAWAVTMVYAATGRMAFGADTVPAVMMRIMNGEPDVAGVPPSLLPVIRQCLEKDPGRRPNARDLMLQLVDPSGPRPAFAGPVPGGSPVPGGGAVPVSDPVPFSGPVPPGTGPVPRSTGPTYAGPGYPGPGYSGPGSTQLPITGTAPQPSRRSRTLPILAACATVVVIALVAGVVLLTRGSSGNTKNGTTTGTAAATTTGAATSPAAQVSSTPPATTPAPATGATIPAAFAGTWAGPATLAPVSAPGVGLGNPITFTLKAGGTTAAEVDGPAPDCLNTLTLTKTTATVLTFNEPGNSNCVAGTVTFALHGTDLAYQWTNNIEVNTATLKKQG
jgi:eukaryotic-like serine/threonine-protein kinase